MFGQILFTIWKQNTVYNWVDVRFMITDPCYLYGNRFLLVRSVLDDVAYEIH